jgi:hypothetical protein
MAGFRKSKAFDEIRVPMIVRAPSEDEKTLVNVEVAHIFKIPPSSVREEYHRMLVKIKNRKLAQGNKSTASWYLWDECILRVEGYDDLGSIDTEGRWKDYFRDRLLRIHIDNAVDMLMGTLNSDEVEEEKNSEPSSEE